MYLSQKTRQSLKVGLWCAVSRQMINGGIFFGEMITAECRQELIINFISVLEVDEQDCWFYQDGAKTSTANLAMQVLSKFFSGHIS
jgi:hypothetical protein